MNRIKGFCNGENPISLMIQCTSYTIREEVKGLTAMKRGIPKA